MAAFHGGRRSCLGEKLAIMQMKYTLFYTLMSFHISLDENWKERVTPAGPITPMMLKIKLNPLKDDVESKCNTDCSSTEETLNEI